MIDGFRRRATVAVLVALGAACESLPSLADVAASPPLPYSVLVSGGAFVTPPSDGGDEPLGRTFRSVGPGEEAFEIDDLVEVLVEGRVFARVARHPLDAASRRQLAANRRRQATSDPEFETALERARADGHDFLLVLEPIRDGRIDARGVNGQWPITAAVWLLIGLGVVIPDHTFESRATLHAVVCDVYTGRSLYRVDLSSTPVDLSLIERSDTLGLLTSILVPPFWVSSDPDAVEYRVRSAARARLLVEFARRLKNGIPVEIEQGGRSRIELASGAAGPELRIRSREGVSQVRFRLDGQSLPAPVTRRLEQALFDSVRNAPSSDALIYTVTLPDELRGRRLQVALQTVGGHATSTTFELPR